MGNKKLKSTRIRSVFVSGLTALTLVTAPIVVMAAPSKTPAPAVNTSPSTLKIGPLRTDLSISAGQTGKATISVYNTTSTAISVKPIENDFVAGDESGKPSLLLGNDAYAPTHSLKRFMQPVSNVTIPANSSADVVVNIIVPKTAQAGGYFGAIRFTATSELTGQQVNLGASVASLILLTVPGPVVDKLTLTNFDVQQNGGTASNFRTPKDLELLLRFENKGNIQESPFGQIYVKKGNKVVYKYDFNQSDPKDVVLPDSARRWNIPLNGFGKFGKYTVGATFGYGNNGGNIDITKTVWIVPTAYILIIGGGILGLILIVGGLFLFLKSYKRKILRSSRRRY